MRHIFKSAAAGLVLTLALSSHALAQDSGKRFFSAESGAYAIEAKNDQAANDHKGAIKNLKKGLKVKGLTPYEASAMSQMLGNSYFATGKEDKAIEAFENAVAAGGLRADEKRNIQVNIAQINIKEKNYAVGAQQLENYFREGGQQKANLVRLAMSSHMRAGNRQAAVPWADVMLRNGFAKTRAEYDTLLYLYDSREKRSDQIRVADRMLGMWPGDAELQAKVEGLKRKATYEAANPS